MAWLVTQSALILALTIVGGLLPMWFGKNGRLLHLLVSLAAGIFLGAVFLHLLPEVASGGHHALEGIGGLDNEHGGDTAWLAVIAGVLVLFFVESLLLRGEPVAKAHVHAEPDAPSGFVFSAQAPAGEPVCHEDHIHGEDRHRMVGLAALIGLSLHAVADGLGLSAGVDSEEIRGALTMAILSHKALGGFSLAIALLLSGMTTRRVLVLVSLFALITPLAALGRAALWPHLGDGSQALLTAFAAGTFLYVALCDLLPEVFHERRDGVVKAGLLVAGVAVSHWMHQL
jgi:zinc and cadmium transporter